MSNKTVTNCDMNRGVGFEDAIYEDDVLTASGAATFAKGTILARSSATLKLVPYVKGGTTNENGIPKAVLSQEVSIDAAGDINVRALVKGSVAKNRLVINADGDASNVDAAVEDELRNYSIIVRDSRELLSLEA